MPNTYTVKIHGDLPGLGPDPPELVTFKDHSGEFVEELSTKKPRTSERVARQVPQDNPIPLPDPHFLRIHSAMCGVLNMSGAGECIDEILDQAEEAGAGARAIPSGSYFDHLMLHEGIPGEFKAAVSVRG